MENVIVDNIQHKANQLQGACAHQYEYPNSEDGGAQKIQISTYQKRYHSRVMLQTRVLTGTVILACPLL